MLAAKVMEMVPYKEDSGLLILLWEERVVFTSHHITAHVISSHYL